MTNIELIRRALAQLSVGQVSPSPWLDAEAEGSLAIPYAMQRLACAIAADPRRRGLLTQDYAVTITGGVGEPLTAVGALTNATDILWEFIKDGQVRDADGNRLSYVAHRVDFEGRLHPALKYFLLDGERIYVRSATSGNYASDLSAEDRPVSVTASFIPTVASLPAQLDDEAVAMLASVLVEKLPSAPKK